MSILKYLVVSLLVTTLSFLVTVSIVTGKFPPTMAQLKGVKKNIETLMALRQQVGGGNGGLTSLQGQLQRMVQKSPGTKNGYLDPEMAEVNEIITHHKVQSQLSHMISGEASFASSPPPTAQSPEIRGGPSVPSPQVEQRIKKLEDLVSHLHEQMQRMNSQLNTLQQSIQHRR